MGAGSRGAVLFCDCRLVALLASSIPRGWWWTCTLREVVQRELVSIFSTQQAAVSCHFPKDNMGAIPFAAALLFPCRPMLLGTSLHRTKPTMHYFLLSFPGMRCKAYLMSSKPGAKFGSIPPCKICAKGRIFWAHQVLLVFKKKARRWAIYVCECHQQAPCEFPVYLSAGGPYSQSPSDSWQGSGGDRACLVVYKSQHLVGPSSSHGSPHCCEAA